MRDANGWVIHDLVPDIRYRSGENNEESEIQDLRDDTIWICGLAHNHAKEVMIGSGPSKGERYSPIPCYIYNPATNITYLLKRYNLVNVVWALQEMGSVPQLWDWHDLVIKANEGRDWL